MEVTRKLTPHHHLMIGPIDGRIRCYGRDFNVVPFRRRFESCECLSHVLSRAWRDVTKDSWLVHTVPVMEGPGAGGYMAKYLTKTFGIESRMEVLGMSRRWSTSRGFPKWDLCLKNKEWLLVMHHAGFSSADEYGTPELLEREGTDVVKMISERRKARRVVRV